MRKNRGSVVRVQRFVAVCAALITMIAATSSASAAPTETVLYSFKGGSDGINPVGRVIADRAGNLYGMAFQRIVDGSFLVFKLAPDGTYTVLHSFECCSDGSVPSGLYADAAGNLYGTAAGGGPISPACPNGCGVVFKLSPPASVGGAWTATVLHFFKGGSDGDAPGGLIADSYGNLYGLTAGGGSGICPTGCGTVFKLAPDGTETVLYSFCSKPGCSDGAFPNALIVDDAGNLYGTTYAGGGANAGTIFKLAPDGDETVVYSFKGKPDGFGPEGGLIADSYGNLYGTTDYGGANETGTIFKLAPDGTETVLHFFGMANGANPGGLIADASGNLYGTTYAGGRTECYGYGCGTVFKLTPRGHNGALFL